MITLLLKVRLLLFSWLYNSEKSITAILSLSSRGHRDDFPVCIHVCISVSRKYKIN